MDEFRERLDDDLPRDRVPRLESATAHTAMMARARLLRFGPPVVWMGVIALLSSDLFSSEETASWIVPVLARLLPGAEPWLLHRLHAALRKLAHLGEYGILAALWLRAFGPAPQSAARAIWLSALYAGIDEARQSLAPHRTPAVTDVLLDTAGALIAVACLAPKGRLARGALGLVRWAAGGVATISLVSAVLDWHLGLPVWDFLAAAVLAVGLAAGVQHLARAWGRPP